QLSRTAVERALGERGHLLRGMSGERAVARDRRQRRAPGGRAAAGSAARKVRQKLASFAGARDVRAGDRRELRARRELKLSVDDVEAAERFAKDRGRVAASRHGQGSRE